MAVIFPFLLNNVLESLRLRAEHLSLVVRPSPNPPQVFLKTRHVTFSLRERPLDCKYFRKLRLRAAALPFSCLFQLGTNVPDVTLSLARRRVTSQLDSFLTSQLAVVKFTLVKQRSTCDRIGRHWSSPVPRRFAERGESTWPSISLTPWCFVVISG
jgi:hypothetical protein